MANVSPRKTPRREKMPARYIGFNAEPENVGTRTGKSMPVGVPIMRNGFEDPTFFIGASSPRAETEMDFDSMRTTTTRAGLVSERSVARATVRSEVTSRSVLNSTANGNGRKSLANLADGNDQDEDEEETGGHAVDSLLDDGLLRKGKGKQMENGSTSQSFEDMDISTIVDTPTKRRSGPHRPRPSASPATASSRPVLSQLADPGLDDVVLRTDQLQGDDSGNAFDDDDEGDVAESPSVRAAKAGDAKRINASKRKFTAMSKRLSKANGGANSLRSLNDTSTADAQASNGLEAASIRAGPSRRAGASGQEAGRRQFAVDGEAGETITDTDQHEADDHALDNDNDNDVDPAFGMDDFDEGFGEEQGGLDADQEQVSSRRSSTRAAAAKSREKTAAAAKGKGKGKKSRASPNQHSVDEFDEMREEEVIAVKSKLGTEKPNARSKPVAKAKRGRKMKETPAAARETSLEPRPRGRSTVQLAAERVERVDEAARTRGRLRSTAERHAPLRYWLGEKPLLKRNTIADKGDATDIVPELQGWLTKEQPVQTLGAKKTGLKRKRAGSNSVPPRTGNKRRTGNEEGEEDYTGWENETEASAIIAKWSPGGSTEEEELRRVACTNAMVRVKAIKNANFCYQKIFGEDEFFAAGVLHIPVGAEKASKNSRDNAYAFHVFKGCVKVSVHRHQFIIAQGGQFMIPRGNFYAIENICKTKVEIFFSQARRLKQSEIEAADQKDAESQSDDGQGMGQDDGSGSEDGN